MKITVGQVLLVVGAGTYAVLGPLGLSRKAGPALEQARNFAADNLPYLESLRVGKPPASPPSTVADPPPVKEAAVLDRLPEAERQASPAGQFAEVPLTPVPPVEAAPQVAAPAKKSVSKPKAAAPKPVVRRRRTRTTSAAAASKRAPAPKAARKPAADALVGTYVALKLKSGNVVKGILLERSATNYKVELPGLGGFDYAANTVAGIAAAE